MKTFNEFYCQKLINEAHKGTPQDFLKLGINPKNPDFIDKLAKIWLSYVPSADAARFMAKQGLIPDDQDFQQNGRKVGMPLGIQKDVETGWSRN